MALLAASLTQGCASRTAAGPGGSPGQEVVYLPDQGALGLKAQDDPSYSFISPFRIVAFIVYPFFLFGQRVLEVPYAVAMQMDPDLFGLYPAEQKYLQDRWGVTPGAIIRGTGSQPAGPQR
jgi:hypothetical protein